MSILWTDKSFHNTVLLYVINEVFYLIQTDRAITERTFFLYNEDCGKLCDKECNARTITVFYASHGRLVLVKKPGHDHPANQKEWTAEINIFTIKPNVEESLTRE